jgi:hypothetical protein
MTITLPADAETIPPTIEPVLIGPVWTADVPTPAETLGYQIIEWAYDNLQMANGDPLTLVGSQIRRLLHFYAVRPDGTPRHREWVFLGHRGSAKSWFGMIVAGIELIGPCRFGGWDEHGEPIAVANLTPWVQVIGTGEEQTKNSSQYLGNLFTKSAVAQYKLDVGVTMVRAPGSKLLEFCTTSPDRLMGGRPSFVVIDEPHLLTEDNEVEVYDVSTDNVAKDPTGWSRIMLTSNAWGIGEDSLAERRWAAYLKAKAKNMLDALGLVWDQRSAPDAVPLTPATARGLLRASFGDAHWVNVETTMRVILDPGKKLSKTKRMWLSIPAEPDTAAFTLGSWQATMAPLGEGLKPGDEVTMGTDPSLTDDSTAVVVVRLSDGYSVVWHLQEKPPAEDGEEADWEMDKVWLDSAVRKAFETFTVRAFFSDVNPTPGLVEGWSTDFGEQLWVPASPKSAVGRAMSGSSAFPATMHARFLEDLASRSLLHPDDANMLQHFTNTRNRGTRFGNVIAKPAKNSPKKIDIIAAWELANQARVEALAYSRTRSAEPDRPKWIALG